MPKGAMKMIPIDKSLLVPLLLLAAHSVASAEGLGVWSETGFSQIDNVDAVPYLTDGGRARYKEFLTQPSPRAFVICPDGRFSRIHAENNATLAKVLLTRDNGCEPYVINDAVVWKD
jgi:hypothetical protein